MPASGIDIPKEIEEAWNELKHKKSLQYVVVELQKKQSKGEKEKWALISTGEAFSGKPTTYVDKDDFKARYEQFIAENLGDEKAVFALFDFSRIQIGPKKNINIIGYQWCPDSCPVGVKMTYASSVETLKKTLKADKLVAGNDMDEVKLDAVLTKFSNVTFDQLE